MTTPSEPLAPGTNSSGHGPRPATAPVESRHRIAEGTSGYFLRSVVGLDIARFPERAAEPEVDFVLTVGEQRIPIEVKYRRHITHEDTLGLRAILEKTVSTLPSASS